MIGRPGKTASLARFINYAKSHDGVRLATREKIARDWLEPHG